MSELQTIPVSTAVSELNAFEIKIQEHEKELDFIPDMSTPEGRDMSNDALKSARKTYIAVDAVRLEKKKEAEVLANNIHSQGKAALARLEVKYNPHKTALDDYKAKQKAIEEAIKQSFFDACQWLHDVANACQFCSVGEIEDFIAEVAAKDSDNTGLEFNKDQKFEYGKIHLNIKPKLEESLRQRIIRDAEDARQLQQAQELAAQQEAMRVQQEELQRQQQEAAQQRAADDARIKAENDAKERVLAAEREVKASAEREESAKKQAVIDSENARINEENRIKQATIQAAEDERLRIEAEQAAEAAEATAREADKNNKAKIHRAIVKELKDKGLSEEDAKTAVKVMANSNLVTINY